MDGFFGIGFGELVMIAIVALIVLGPERLPSALREVAKFIRQVRNLSQEFTSQFGDDFKALEDLNPRRLLQEAIDNIDEEENAKDGKSKTPAKKSTTPATAVKKTTPTPAKAAAAKNGVAKSTTASTTAGAAPKSTATTPAATPKSDDDAPASEIPAADMASTNDDKTNTTSEKIEASAPEVEAMNTVALNTVATTDQPSSEPENRIAPPPTAEPSVPQANATQANPPSFAEPPPEVVQTNGHADPSVAVDSNSKTASDAPANADAVPQTATVDVFTERAAARNGQLDGEETRL